MGDGCESLGDDLSVNTTPQFYVNGQRLLGAAPFESFAQLIDEALTNARSLVATGIRHDRVYDEIVKTAVAPAAPERRTFPRATSTPVRGAVSAQVTIQELGDFQSPYTRRASACDTRIA